MRRFWTRAETVPYAGAWAVALDGKIAMTPGRVPLATRHRELAKAAAEEWARAPETLQPQSMTMTGFLNAVIDRIRPNKEALAADVARFAGHELICYRADGPAELVKRQCAGWDPIVAWVRDRHGAKLTLGVGVAPIAQPPEALARLKSAVDELDPYRLAAAVKLTGITKSLCLTLAVIGEAAEAITAYELSRIDEAFQTERWGEDAEAARRVENERAELTAVAEFLRCLD